MSAENIFHVPFWVTRQGEKRTFATKAELQAFLAFPTMGGAARLYMEPRGDVQVLYNGYLHEAPLGVYTVRGPGSLNTGVGKRLTDAMVFTWTGTLTISDNPKSYIVT